MDDAFLSYVWAAIVATIVTGYGIFYVFESAASRGLKSGLFAGFGLALGLLVFGSFPIVETATEFLKNTHYFQYVRIVIIVLALLIALFIFLDFRAQTVHEPPSAWVYIRVFLLGFLMNVLTPLPLSFYNEMLSKGGLLESAGALLEKFVNVQNPFSDPVQNLTLPIVAFLIYWLTAFLGKQTHRSVLRSDGLRLGLMIIGLLVFIGVAAYVGFRGATYEQTLVDKITNFGLSFF